MRTIMLTIIATSIVAATMHAAIRHGNEVTELNDAITVLERELAHSQTMLDDAHALYPILERRVIEVTTDRTAREVIWMLQETIGDCAMVEVY